MATTDLHIQRIGYLLFWFFFGMKLRVFQLDGLGADPLDLLMLVIGSFFIAYHGFRKLKESLINQ